MDLIEKEEDGMDRIHLHEDRNKWRAPVNTIMKLWVP
jgi:hypothetical protein